MTSRLWLFAARAQRRLARRPPPDREAALRRHAPGRSVADVGGMWGADGAAAFTALAAGATRVTEIDLMRATPRIEAEPRIAFVQGDVHDEAVVALAGRHDVVWCAGVLYHAPHPVLTLERLRGLVEPGGLLLLHTASLPELPGAPGATVFYPAARRPWAPAAGGPAVGLTEPFDAARGYENWWWGLTPSAVRGMLSATGWTVLEEERTPFHVSVTARG